MNDLNWKRATFEHSKLSNTSGDSLSQKMPEPLASKKFSGHFMVRVPPELHRQLAMEAAEAGVSLNRLASDKLRREGC